MRTTLDIADDVLQAAKELAKRERKTIGQMISELARRALTTPQGPLSLKEPKAVYGFKPFARRGGIVTNELIDKRFSVRLVTVDTGIPLAAVRKATRQRLLIL
jgi:hypothetical protein